MKEALTFNDVNIVPGFSDIGSRKDVSLSSMGMGLPVIAANMDSVVNSTMAYAMLGNGAQACLHRFCTIDQNVKDFRDSCNLNKSPMASIGLGNKELERAEALFNAGCHSIVIDVAHGAQLSVAKQACQLREIIGNNGCLIVGNFASSKSVRDFLSVYSSIDVVKVGIGPGAACTDVQERPAARHHS